MICGGGLSLRHPLSQVTQLIIALEAKSHLFNNIEQTILGEYGIIGWAIKGLN